MSFTIPLRRYKCSIINRLSYTLTALVFSTNGCQQSAANSEYIPIAETKEVDQRDASKEPAISFSYATKTGLELELAYQKELETMQEGKHIITVGHNGEGNLYMGSLDKVVKTLERELKGEVVILPILSKTELLEYLATNDSRKIDTLHSFGHGDDTRYWITGIPSAESLTVDNLLMLPREQIELIQNAFSANAYWKFYSCHGAGDNGIIPEVNIVKTVAEVFDIKTIGANAWVFLEATKAGTYMYPASRERHEKEFAILKPYLSIPTPDPLYTQKEAAWVTYTPQK